MKYSSWILFLLIFVSCKGDASQSNAVIEMNHLKGKWKIFKAYKAKKQTQLLSNAYFEFSNDDQVKSNIHPTEDFVPFKTVGKQIKIEEPSKINYKILGLVQDTLELSTKMRGVVYDLILIKEYD